MKEEEGINVIVEVFKSTTTHFKVYVHEDLQTVTAPPSYRFNRYMIYVYKGKGTTI
jgi:hypothetical protein